MEWQQLDISIRGLRNHYRNGDFAPAELIDYLLERNTGDNPIWVHRLSVEELAPYLRALIGRNPDSLPLYGVPFAIKDNIDLAGIPTTAGCPDYAYIPSAHATVVGRLIAAGAIPLGKTQLDQFATGLVGTRSPRGACQNSFDPTYVSGGSSSGSAVATALGLVSFALGTDTAGSGRVPAGFNNLVGLKPSIGLLPTTGVVPACRSLDCVSIFALSTEEAEWVFTEAKGEDPSDPYSRANPPRNARPAFGQWHGRFRFAIADVHQLEFDEPGYAVAYQQAIQSLQAIGGEPVTLDFSPLLDAAKLLYQGPWVAERYAAVGAFIETKPDSVLPVIRDIILPGAGFSALDMFRAQYQLQGYARKTEALLAGVDCAMLPTTPGHPTREAVDAAPLASNSRLGLYTNFMNLLDLAAVAVPTQILDCGRPFGVTLFGPAFSDRRLLSLAATLQASFDLPMGATGLPCQQQLPPRQLLETIDVVVCGAHLSGLPLNFQLIERGATLVQQTHSAPHYRLYALPGGPPYRPGMVRDEGNGAAIEVEVWRVPAEHFGSFVAGIPAPLGIGKLELVDGRWVPGFICEPAGIPGAEEITGLGGWRKYLSVR